MPMTVSVETLSGHILDQWLTGPKIVGGWKYPSQGYSKSVYYDGSADMLLGRYQRDGMTVPAGVVVYMHGSGQDELPPLDHYLFNALIALDYVVICAIQWGRGRKDNLEYYSRLPFRYTYGNTHSPDYVSELIRKAQWVAASLAYAKAYVDSVASVAPFLPVVVLGQSYGATAALAFNAYSHFVPVGSTDILVAYEDVMDVLNFPNFRGFVINGMTQAAWGGGSEAPAWNDVNRIINHYTPLVTLAQRKMLMLYGDADSLASPDFAKRMQMAIPAGAQTAILGAGTDAIHGWMNTPAGAPIAAEWVRQMMVGAPITTLAGQTTGELATFGPAA